MDSAGTRAAGTGRVIAAVAPFVTVDGCSVIESINDDSCIENEISFDSGVFVNRGLVVGGLRVEARACGWSRPLWLPGQCRDLPRSSDAPMSPAVVVSRGSPTGDELRDLTSSCSTAHPEQPANAYRWR